MPLVLPDGHPLALRGRGWSGGAAARPTPPLRVGIVNVMPRAELYEASVLEPFAAAGAAIAPVLIRLRGHAYKSSDPAHLARFYRSPDAALADGPLDGLVVTGAPVEALPYEEVRYFGELAELLTYAREHVTSTLGLCWGGLALAKRIGVEKRLFATKLFGVFESRVLVGGHPLLGGLPEGSTFPCPQSRHSGADPASLRIAEGEGRVRLLCDGDESGHSVFETPDGRYVMHLGHPEYEAARLVFEWERDRGRADVPTPRGLDVARAETTWREHRRAFFSGWVERLAAGRPAQRTPEVA